METYGILWKIVEFYGILWNLVESYFTFDQESPVIGTVCGGSPEILRKELYNCSQLPADRRLFLGLEIG